MKPYISLAYFVSSGVYGPGFIAVYLLGGVIETSIFFGPNLLTQQDEFYFILLHTF